MVRRIAPSPDEPDGPALERTLELVELGIAGMYDWKARGVKHALALFGSRAAALLTVGRFVPFALLSPLRQDAMLARWAESPLGPQRTVFQLLRRLTLLAHYERPEVQAGIGYLGPFFQRTRAVAWEGSLAGIERDDEPVARVDDASRTLAAPGAEQGTGKAAEVGARREALAFRDAPTASSSPDQILTADVVVIGTGAGGAVAAARLSEAGWDVVILESGSHRESGDFDEHEHTMREQLYAERGLRATDDLSVAMLQGECVGGSTTVNWMIMLRTPDYVLEEWSTEHGVTGLSSRELRPVFERIESETHARRVPEDAHSPANRILLDGAQALGWRARSAMINARGCVRSGFCGQGCRYGAKQSALVTYMPRALAAGARLVANARADRIELLERGGRRAKKRVHAQLRDPATGRVRDMVRIDAPLVIVAAGAVETPVLLQRSGMGGGGVGRFLRLHPTTAVVGVHDRDIYAAGGIPLSAVCDHFLDRDRSGYGYWIECPPLHPGIGAVATPGVGAEHRAIMTRFRNMAPMIALVRDGANRGQSNGSVMLDRQGRTRISYRLGREDGAHLRAGIEAAARLQLAAGAHEVVTLHTRPPRIRHPRDLDAIQELPIGPNQIGLFSAHVNGTCRMSTDPRTSGTTPDGERHGVPGVYVCDGSLLPTAPGVNPQETIMAIATVLAERIVARGAV